MNLPSRRLAIEAGAAQALEMLRRVGDRKTGAVGQHLDAAFALRKLFQKLQAMGMPQRFRHSGELSEERLFRTLA